MSFTCQMNNCINLHVGFNPVSEEVLYKYSVAGLVDDLFNNM